MLHHELYSPKFMKTTTLNALYLLASFLYASFLTPYFLSLGFSTLQVGVLFSLFAFGMMIASPVIGTISDRIGRFHIMIFGFIVEMIALAGYLLFTNFWLVSVVRLLAAVSFASVTLSARSRIHDIIKNDGERGRVSGVYESLTSVSVAVAPLAGGFLADTYGFSAVFLIALAIIVLIVIFLSLFDLSHYHQPPQKKHVPVTLRDLNPFADVLDFLKFKQLRAMAYLGFAANFSGPFWNLVLPLIIIDRFGGNNKTFGFAILLIGLAHVFQYSLGQFSDRIGEGRGILIGAAGLAITLLFLIVVPNLELLFVIVLLRGILGALWNVSAWAYMSTIGERCKIEGKVVGSYTSLIKLSAAISYLVSGALLLLGFHYVLLLYCLLILGALGVTFKTFNVPLKI